MLKKFISIKNVGKITDYVIVGDVEFRKLNLVYGENGSGKTTLSVILRSLKKNKPEYITGRKTIGATDNPEVILRVNDDNIEFRNGRWSGSLSEIEIFDALFIAENICAGFCVDHQHKKNLPIFALGEGCINFLADITALDESIRQKNYKIRQKEIGITGSIESRLTIEEFLNLPQDANIVKLISDQRSKVDMLKQAETILKKSLLDRIPAPTWRSEETLTLLAKELVTISKDAETKIQLHLRKCLDQKGEGWLEYGLQHIVNNKCPFCGLELKTSNLITVYQQYFSGEYKELKTAVAVHNTKVNGLFSYDNLLKVQRIIVENESLHAFYIQSKFHDIELMRFDFNDFKSVWDKLSQLLKANLQQKLLSPLDQILPGHELTALIDKYNTMTEAINEYNTQIDIINNAIGKKKKTLDVSRLGNEENTLRMLQNQEKRYTPEVINLIEEYKRLRSEKRDCEIRKEETKTHLNQLTADVISKYQPKINDYLEKFGADFRISGQKIQYVGGKPSIDYCIELCGKSIELGDWDTPLDQPSFKNTLSEGDKSTLAFAFFLAKLDQDTALSGKIVIFDDPINSLDIHRRNCTIQNILMINQIAQQVIVLTHEPMFARSIWREAQKSTLKCLRVLPTGRAIHIKEWDIEQETAGEYFQNYFALSKFLEDGSGDLRTVARCIRPLIEGNLRLRFPGNFKEEDWLGDFINKIHRATIPDPLVVAQPSLAEIEDINSYSKRFHHGHNPNADADSVPINPTELKTYVARTLKLIGSVLSA
jgi:wobble nucleotide-excising tRNase